MKTVRDEWSRVLSNLREVNGVVVEVGWFDPDAARIAFINDRGGNRGNNPPPRPVLAPGMDAAREDVKRLQARALKRVLNGADGATVMRETGERVGETIEQAVRDAIDQVQPPNAPSTIAQKHGYAAPLRGFRPDRIWNRLTYRVVPTSEAARDNSEDSA